MEAVEFRLITVKRSSTGFEAEFMLLSNSTLVHVPILLRDLPIYQANVGWKFKLVVA